jgi:hypothetical protein
LGTFFPGTNTLAYFVAQTGEKREKDFRAQYFKTFISVIYKFL